MPAPFTVPGGPGDRTTTELTVDGQGNLGIAGDLKVGHAVLLADLAQAPIQTPGYLTLYTLDGTNLSLIGAGGTAGGVVANGVTNWANVVAAGATGNGVTNDAAAIQTAINTVGAAGGGVVYFPAGTYSIGAGLVIAYDNVRLLGDGKDASIIKPTTGATFDAISTAIPAAAGNPGYIRSYLGIEHLGIDCSRMTGTVDGAGNGIHLYGARYSYIRDVYVTASPNFAIVLDGDSTNSGLNVEVRQCLMTAGAAGLLVNFTDACFITHNEILAANLATASNQPAFAPQFTIGFLMRLVSGYHLVQGNVLSNGGTYTSPAIQVESSNPTRIVSNRFDRCRYQAIRVAAANCSILGNQIGSAGSANTGVEAIRVGASTTNIFANMFDVTAGGPAYTYCIAEVGGPFVGNVYAGNSLTAGTTGVINQDTGSTNRIVANAGYDPVGFFSSQPAVPATTVAQVNKFGVDATVHVTGGTVSAIAVGGTATGLTSGTFRVPSGQSITLTYTVAPTWKWYGD